MRRDLMSLVIINQVMISGGISYYNLMFHNALWCDAIYNCGVSMTGDDFAMLKRCIDKAES